MTRRAGRFSRRFVDRKVIASASAPGIVGLSSSGDVRWSGAKSVTVNGVNFDPLAVVKVNNATTIRGGTVTTTFVSSTQLTAGLPREALWETGPIVLTVTNPDAQVSGGEPYTISQTSQMRAERHAGAVTLSSGTDIQTFIDQSGSGDAARDWTQLTIARQATLTAVDAAYNNQATALLAPLDFYESGIWSAALTQPCTVFFVGAVGSTADFRTIWDQASAPTAQRLQLIALNTSGLPRILANATGLVGVTPLTPGAKTIIVGLYNTASSALYTNSKTAQILGAVGATTTGMPADRLGLNVSGVNPMDQKFAYFAVLQGAVSQALREEVIDYLAWRYGVTLV